MKTTNNKNYQKNYLQLEEILKERGLLTQESILKNVIKNERVKQVGRIILAAAFISGVVVISTMAPNLLSAIGKLSRSFRGETASKFNKIQRKKISKTITNLQTNKLIEQTQQDDKIILKITPRGRAAFLKRYIYELKIKKPKKWDGLWRVVIFDIPNEMGTRRDIFRQRLKKLGFFQFQKSAFIVPYPCLQELEAILSYYNLFDCVTYLEATHVSGEEKCRRFFDF